MKINEVIEMMVMLSPEPAIPKKTGGAEGHLIGMWRTVAGRKTAARRHTCSMATAWKLERSSRMDLSTLETASSYSPVGDVHSRLS